VTFGGYPSAQITACSANSTSAATCRAVVQHFLAIRRTADLPRAYRAVFNLSDVVQALATDLASIEVPRPRCEARVLAVLPRACGTAAAQKMTMVVPDVHKFPGHIACDSASNSEIVVPLIRKGRLIGVLDIDSPSFGRLAEAGRAGCEAVAATYVAALDAWMKNAIRAQVVNLLMALQARLGIAY
jgi:GAF domain-containing protein